MKKLNKKGFEFDQIIALVIGMVIIGIVLTIGFLVLASNVAVMDDDASLACADDSDVTIINASGCYNSSHLTSGFSTSRNATTTTVSGLAGIPGWLSIFVVTIVGVILFGLITMLKRRK